MRLPFIFTAVIVWALPILGLPSASNHDASLVSNAAIDANNMKITYTPYVSDSGQCKTANQVLSDLTALKQRGFTTVRLFSGDCNALAYITPACKQLGMRMIIDILIPSSGCSIANANIRNQVDNIAKWAQWDYLELVVVGNDAIGNGLCSATDLQQLIVSVKNLLSGYRGPYSTGESLTIWQSSEVRAALCDTINVTGGSISPYFAAKAPSEAGEYVADQLTALSKVCSTHTYVIALAKGWPTAGNTLGPAVPGVNQQATALKSIRNLNAQGTIIFYHHQDERWSSPGDCRCNQHWGIGNHSL